MPLRIALAQKNFLVGDLQGNTQIILDALDQARDQLKADAILFPELALTGYPPEDLLLRPAFLDAVEAALQQITLRAQGIVVILGYPERADGHLHTSAIAVSDGQVLANYRKQKLPNYGVFDEKRYFKAGHSAGVFALKGHTVGLTICEDIWHPDVCRHLADFGAELLLCVNGSPYEIDKDTLRIDGVAKRRAVDNNLPLAYVNRVGGQDELVFDGASFVINGDGTLAVQMKDWEEQEVTTRWTRTATGWRCDAGEIAPLADHPEDIYCAMVLALRDYVDRNRFPGVVLGLSGGIDSAICAAIAADALGPDRVWCVMLPSRYTSQLSLDLATECAQMIGCRYDTIPIAPAVEAFDTMLAGSFADRAVDLTEENIQSRIRGVTLMALSNKFGPMLLTTGNKSEMSVGYATIYGDMAGGYNPLKDAYKMTVFAISEWRNQHKPRIGLGPDGPVMPEGIITRPPSAELRPDQKDEDSLPPYPVLDGILHGLVEHEKSVDQLVSEGFERDTVIRIERLLYLSEYKRRQAPPGVKLGTRNFGRDRRYPITNAFRSA